MQDKLNISGMMKQLVLLVFLFAGSMLLVHAQPVLDIDEVGVCENSTAEVSLNVADFFDVAAFTLFIEVDTAALVYDTLINQSVQLSGGMVIASLVSWDVPTIIITWSSITPANIESGKLFDLKFSYIEGNAPLQFNDNCEIVLSDLSIVEDAGFDDGMVFPLISITGHPQGCIALEGESAIFTVSQSGGTLLQWQEKISDTWEDIPDEWPYNGMHSEQLTITEVPLSFDGNRYRCRIMADDCEKISNDALLEVTPLTIHNSIKAPASGFIRVFPLPCEDELNFEVIRDMDAIRLHLVDLMGRVVFKRSFDGVLKGMEGSVSLRSLDAGMYQLQIFTASSYAGSIKVLKL